MGTTYRTYAAKLSIPGKSNDELTYTFHESSLEHNHVPLTLFGVFSIKSISEQYQLLIGETVKSFLEYYRKITESTTGTFKQDGINSQEFIFENAIQYTHERVTQALLEAQDERGKIHGIDMKKVHFVIGVLCEGQLYASITGNGIHAIYFYPIYQKHGFSHYANVDVIGGKEHGEQNTSTRLFSSIISGSVSIPRSILALCNNSFLDYISPEQLKQVVTGNTVESVAPYFQRLLGKINAKNDFCALFLDAHYTRSTGSLHRQQTASNESMAVLNSKEVGTEKILFPAFAAQIKKIIPLLWRGMLFCLHALQKTIHTHLPIAIQTLKKSFSQSTQKTKYLSERLISSIQKKHQDTLYQDVPKNIPPPQKHIDQKQFIKNIRGNISSLWNTFSQHLLTIFKNIRNRTASQLSILPHTSKSLLFISLIFLALFGASIIIIQKKNTEQKQQRALTTILANAEEKNNLAEASLLYDNTEKARALLIEAQQLLRNFPSQDTKSQERYKKILERMQGITERVHRITPLKNISALADFSSSIQNSDQLKLTVSDSTVLTYTASGAYTVDLLNGAIIPIQTQTKIPSISCSIGLEKTNFYLCDAETNRVYKLDTTSGSIQPIPLSLAKEETALDALALYNHKLYVFTASQGSLFRHKKTVDGFDSGSPLIKNPALISQQSSSFAIDGSIYMLQGGDQILKYTSGKQEPFILPLLEPRITHIQKIWTDSDASALYLLEPSQKRLLVIDKKTRTLKAQLISDTFGSAQDFAIISKKKILLVLSGTTLYQSPLDTK